MSNPEADFRQSLVAAVQAELQRHASAVVAEVERLRKEGVEEREALRRELQGQVGQLAHLVEQMRGQVAADVEKQRAQYEARVLESESRQTRRLDDTMAGIENHVAQAARPLLLDVKADHERMGAKVDGLEGQLRKFDEQAARMVTYFNELTQKIDQRQTEGAAALSADVQAKLAEFTTRIDDNDSNIRRFQSEINQLVTQRINDAEDRVNGRVLAAESRMKESTGEQVAEIQAHVGRVSSTIDETMVVLNNRLEHVDGRFDEIGRRADAIEDSVRGVDREALDDLSAKMSNAVGEAMLVRIEMERFQKDVNERADVLLVRLNDVETQLQDAVMDVSTQVQLDRLEEVERMVYELDPTKLGLASQTEVEEEDEMPSTSEAIQIDYANFGNPNPVASNGGPETNDSQDPLTDASAHAEEASDAPDSTPSLPPPGF